MHQGSGHKPEPFFHICRTLFYNSICQGSQCYAATRSLENKMEEYNKNDKVEEIEENISVEEENIISEEEDSRDLLLKQGAVNSLERMYKLWWIPLVVMVLSIFALIPGFLLIALGKPAGNALTVLAGTCLLVLVILVLSASACISGIAGIVLLYRYWKFLPAEEAYTTPAKAVGYMFIPGFNLYWIFVVCWKLSKSYDKLLGRKTSSCTVVACIYAVFFCISSFFGYLSQISVFVLPELAVVSELMSCFTLPVLVLYIAMTSLLQKTVREYLKGTVANWKNNPSFSRFPLFGGIFAGVVLTVVLWLFFLSAGIANQIYNTKKNYPEIMQKQNLSPKHTHSHHQ